MENLNDLRISVSPGVVSTRRNLGFETAFPWHPKTVKPVRSPDFQIKLPFYLYSAHDVLDLNARFGQFFLWGHLSKMERFAVGRENLLS